MPQRVGHLVAAAHDVADSHGSDLEIDHLRGQRSGPVEPVRLDVGICDFLNIARIAGSIDDCFDANFERSSRAPAGAVTVKGVVVLSSTDLSVNAAWAGADVHPDGSRKRSVPFVGCVENVLVRTRTRC